MVGIKKGSEVVVTTAHKGVFFGTYEGQLKDGATVLTNARVCLYWSKETRGFVGLAATGPMEGSRISTACPRMELEDVTAKLECTQPAVERWNQE